MAWNPTPALGGALWQGNQTLATTRQLLSTSAGLASTINANNTSISSINISTGTLRAGFAFIDQISTANITGSGFLGSLLIGDPDDGGIVQIASEFEVRNTVVGPSGLFIIDATQTSINWGAGGISFNGSPWAPINPVGTFTSLTAPVGYIDSISSLRISTGQLRVGTSAFDSISTLLISTGSAYIATSAIDSISSIFISTGAARVGVADVGTLTVGGITLSGNLDMCNNNINNVATLTATTVNAGTVGATAGNFTTLSGTLTGNVSGNLTGNVTGNISNANLTVLGQYSITETADVGSAISNYANYGTVNITGKGGLGGIVNITADVATPLNPAVTVSQLTAEAKGNFGLITPGSPVGYVPRGGLVNIIARQGLTPSPPAEVTSALFANGEIDLTAYSYGIVPGLIKLNSGANEIYAGAVTPITGVIGYNYVFGQFGNNITAGLPPGGIPTVPGENYLYGLNGTVIDNGLYTDTIYNKFGGNLNLDGRASNIIITASNIGGSISLNSPTITLSGSTAINLTGSPTISGNLDMTDGNINNVATISATSGSNLLIQNSDHFINFPIPVISYATGGTITQDSGRTIHTFTSDGTFQLLVPVGTVEVMGIGGGGGGGGLSGGGGGAGNFVVVESALSVGSYTVTVGPGGAGGTALVGGTAGSQSRFSATGINIRMLGGGGGSTEGFVAGNGGCGGGGSTATEAAGGTAGTGVTTGMTSLSNVAFDGGTNPNGGNLGCAGSGGGGVFSIGLGVSGISPAEGGDGGGAIYYLGTYYGGGGGGSAAPTGAYGAPGKGRGGGTAPPTSGGNGSLGATSTQAQPGVANTGGGGGGGEDANAGFAGAAGGSGIVIVSYLTPQEPLFTLGTRHSIFFSTSTVIVGNDLFVVGNTNITSTNVNNINSVNITTTGTADFSGPSTIITGQLLGQNNKPIAITTGVATGFWNPSGSVGTVTASGAASFSNADNPSGFAVADFNAYMSLLSFNNLNATDFYLSDQRIQQNSAGTYWSADCDAIAYNPNVYLSNQNVQWIVNGLFFPKSLS
jgi:hypothetical protein